jgi:lipopolysaccharide transport system ATP-binding protein
MREKDVILKVENVSKLYRLGSVGTGTFGGDVQRFWKTKILGQEDPFMKIGQINDRTSKQKADFVWALQDINFEVKRGEVLGIIGKNGAGKSTLLKLLSRITSPTTGSIKSAGRMASLLEVGTGFHPELTGRENIYLNGAILGMTKKEIQSKFDEIVDFSGCEMYIDTPTKRYSSGMTVRLGFAVAAFLDPEILVVDEVLAVGDAEFQKKAIGKMKEVSSGGGRTVLFVSHNMASIATLCSRAILMENGSIAIDTNVNLAIDQYLETNNVQIRNGMLMDSQFRRGNGMARIIDCQFDENGYFDDDKIIFEFLIEINEELSEIYFSLALRNPINNREFVTTIKPSLIGQNKLKNDRITFTLELNRSILREANYPLYFWIGNVNKEIGIVAENEPYDVIDGVYILKIKSKKNRLELGYDPHDGFSGSFNLNYKFENLDKLHD